MQINRLAASVALLGLCACNPTARPVVPDRRGGRGESCLTTNDCKEPLLCIADRCLDEELSFAATSKVCVSAQCISSSDCCPPLSKAQQGECVQLKKDCDEFHACSGYNSTCKCEETCVSHSCVSSASECESSSDCLAGSCKNHKCVECSKDADCGKGFICEESSCQLACQRDEACGPLQQCKTGRCVDRDCESDRECAFLLGVRDAVCKSGACGIPCQDNAQCANGQGGELTTCSHGLCKFVGCETNAECAAHERTSPGEGRFSLCLSQTDANEVR